ncbi:MAG TPA: hypothetical protein VF784_16130 [Anaerolineales bacterium]
MEAVAEGIDTGEPLSDLRGRRFGFGQDFLLPAPLDPDSLDLRLKKMREGSA